MSKNGLAERRHQGKHFSLVSRMYGPAVLNQSNRCRHLCA